MIGDCELTEGPQPSPSRSTLLTMDQKHSSQDIFISISGIIGAGKTTLATKLAEKMTLPCFYEPVMDNAYLTDFYRDPARYSFPLQVIFNLSKTVSPTVISTGIFVEQKVPATSADHMAGTRRSSGQDNIRRLSFR